MMTENLFQETAKTAPQMKVLREDSQMERYVGAASTQAVVDGEVALPGGLREETRVLSSEAMAVCDKCEAMTDRVEVDGKVIFHVLYTQGDPTLISSLEASAEFSQSLDVPGASPKMTANCAVMVEHVEATAQSGRLHLQAILRVCTRVLTDTPVSIVTGVQDADGLMIRTAPLKSCLTVATGTRDALVRDEFDLAGVLQVQVTLYANAVATVTDVMGGEERATISGNVMLEVMHRSAMPSRPIVVTRHSIPFEETVALTGANGDALCCDAVVKDVAVLSQAGADEGDRVLRAEVLLGLTASATRQREAVALLDAYTTMGDALQPVTQEVRRALDYRRLHTAESGKITLMLEGEQPPARTPIKAFLRPIVTAAEPSGGKLNLEGMMETTLLYMTDDSAEPVSYSTEEPFRMTFACDLCDADSLTLVPTNIDVTGITSDRVEIKYILHVFAYDVLLGADRLVSDVQRIPAEPVDAGVVLYFAQPDETLWDIAKRYRVSRESLRRMNPALSDEGPFDTAQNIILWRRG